ncbi:MAG TPA: glutamate--cysteine ligase [Deltaproteobacteria bacterium]|nr:glutamate--cysteine ligase [Deltaproteobacteria bacterium]
MLESGLFATYGLELEYMLVHAETLEVMAIADEVLRHDCGAYCNSVEKNGMAWSNELALHVIEIKNDRPVAALGELLAPMERQVVDIRKIAAALNATLLPTAMHPWMDPHTETKLWPHGNKQIYNTYNRIFDCRGHGWSNVQSTHLNLGFAGDEQFGRLHAAIRLLLPILPALAASSPIADGKFTGLADTRLDYYRANQRRVPILTGKVIPEQVFTESDYQQQIFARIDAAIAPFDPEQILEPIWLNSRGAIARFDRGAIEIRVLDIQECPLADIAIALLISEVLRMLVDERWLAFDRQQGLAVAPLAEIFGATVADGREAVIADQAYLQALGMPETRATAQEIWLHLAAGCEKALNGYEPRLKAAINDLLRHGNLAQRIVRAVGGDPDRGKLREVYGQLAACLAEGRLFLP